MHLSLGMYTAVLLTSLHRSNLSGRFLARLEGGLNGLILGRSTEAGGMSAGDLYTLGPVLSAFGRLDCHLDSGEINGLCDGQCGRVRRTGGHERGRAIKGRNE